MRTFLIIGLVTALAVMVAAPASAQIFSENWDSYSVGQNATEGTNPNGWQAASNGTNTRFSWFGNKTLGAGAGLGSVVDTTPHSKTMGSTQYLIEAPIPNQSGSKVVTLQYSLQQGGTAANWTYIGLMNSATGDHVGVGSIHGGNQVDAKGPGYASLIDHNGGASGHGWWADVNGSDSNADATMTLTIDLGADTVIAEAVLHAANGCPAGSGEWCGQGASGGSAGDPWYAALSGADRTIPNALTIPDISFDRIVIGGTGSGFGRYDNIVFIPEPASLALIALGGLTMLRRRRA